MIEVRKAQIAATHIMVLKKTCARDATVAFESSLYLFQRVRESST